MHDDMPPYVAHGLKYIVTDKTSSMYRPFGPPFHIGIPLTSVSQVSRVDPKTGPLEIMAPGMRSSVGIVAMVEAALALCGVALPDGPALDHPEAFQQNRGGCWRRRWKPMAACRCTWTTRR